MKIYKIVIFILSFTLLFASQIPASQIKPSGFLEAYCGSAVLREVFTKLGIRSNKQNLILKELNYQADSKKGI